MTANHSTVVLTASTSGTSTGRTTLFPSSRLVTVYVTVPESAADDIAGQLVSERLAACVNAVPCDSTYRWEGSVHRDSEVILLVKTTSDAVERLTDRIGELHPYDVPCIEQFEEDQVLPAFADWRADSVD
ncbi:divalent-cation tolerance protein CutA [Salinibaculum salinum]|uniref:divalent-cation tolerance protein CutA n=1 Tax=Salinibaculum salinum TaxID=3131996 RepID=UPI0030ECED9A